jgi:hypothetical protein
MTLAWRSGASADQPEELTDADVKEPACIEAARPLPSRGSEDLADATVLH